MRHCLCPFSSVLLVFLVRGISCKRTTVANGKKKTKPNKHSKEGALFFLGFSLPPMIRKNPFFSREWTVGKGKSPVADSSTQMHPAAGHGPGLRYGLFMLIT